MSSDDTAPDRYTVDDVEPWALNLVVRVERDRPVLHGDLLEAAAKATVALLLDDRASSSWEGAIARWHDGRIRKLCRRARGAKWDVTTHLAHVEVTVRTATVRAFVPCAVAAQPAELAKLQMTGTDFEDGDRTTVRPLEARDLVVWISPIVEMTSAKAAVQASHAAQLVVEKMRSASPERLAKWVASGGPLVVRDAGVVEWQELCLASEKDEDLAVVHDAGFTEVAAGSLTAIGVTPNWGD
jgi:peptidyl-tRNA hydrolase